MFGQIAELDFPSRIVGKGQVNVRKQQHMQLTESSFLISNRREKE